jgi:hypothetical protein
MKLTIIPADKAVYKDGISFLNLTFTTPSNIRALQWDSAQNKGWVEFETDSEGITPPNQSITELPDWAVQASTVWDAADYTLKNPPAPTEAELIKACKVQAEEYLQQTDWSEIPSVSDTSNAMHLLNIEDFISYRVQVRALRVNPVANPTFPTMPTPQWSS